MFVWNPVTIAYEHICMKIMNQQRWTSTHSLHKYTQWYTSIHNFICPVFPICSKMFLSINLLLSTCLLLDASLDGTRFCITNLVKKRCNEMTHQFGIVWICLKYKICTVHVKGIKGISKTKIYCIHIYYIHTSLYNGPIMDYKRADIELEGHLCCEAREAQWTSIIQVAYSHKW